MLYTTTLVAQLIGEEQWFGLRQKREFIKLLLSFLR